MFDAVNRKSKEITPTMLKNIDIKYFDRIEEITYHDLELEVLPKEYESTFALFALERLRKRKNEEPDAEGSDQTQVSLVQKYIEENTNEFINGLRDPDDFSHLLMVDALEEYCLATPPSTLKADLAVHYATYIRKRRWSAMDSIISEYASDNAKKIYNTI